MKIDDRVRRWLRRGLVLCLLASTAQDTSLARAQPRSQPQYQPQSQPQSTAQSPRFVERSVALGVDFVHQPFGTGEKFMPENMGAGVAIFDADGDERLDLYFVQGTPLPGPSPADAPPNRLFRQRPDGTFEDLRAASGADDRGYGMGVIHGDVDGDGDRDLYVTNFGPNALYLNRGDGTFVRTEAGVEDSRWSVGAAFFDPDRDGDLDLYVVNYVDFGFDRHKWCGNARLKLRSYCHPDVYDGLGDVFYRNRGDGTFEDHSLAVGIRPSAEAKGLGVLAADLDGDGHQDVYVANDSTGNQLYLGQTGGLGFREEALLAGLGFNGQGAAEASMGIAYGDFDGDGSGEIFLTHLDQETNTLYRPQDGGFWVDATARAGLEAPSRPWVGFGTLAIDADHDGDLDLVVVNGHIIDNIALFDPSRSHRQPAQFFENHGDGTFIEQRGVLGLDEPLVGRGLAAGDLDRDGDLDLVITQNGGRALILMAEDTPPDGTLLVELEGKSSNPDGVGARLELTAGGGTQYRQIFGGGSYLSQGAPETVFGLGRASKIDELVVHWPSGRVDQLRNLAPGRIRIVEGEAGETPAVPGEGEAGETPAVPGVGAGGAP